MKSSGLKVRSRLEKLRLLGIFSDRANLVLDVGAALHDGGLDLDKLKGITSNGRFAMSLSAIGKDTKRLVDHLTNQLGGEILATIDGEPYAPKPSMVKSLQSYFTRNSSAENGLLILGTPSNKEWIKFRQTLANGARKVVRLCEFSCRDTEGELNELDWASAVYEFQAGPRPMSFLGNLERNFAGHGKFFQLPEAMAIPAFKLRREVTVEYLRTDIQGVFFELMHSVQTSRAVVHAVEAEKYFTPTFGGQGFASEFQVAVSDVQTQQDLESLFRLRKQLAVDMTVKFGWDRLKSIAS